MEDTSNKQLILKVMFDEEANSYDVLADKGTSVAEMLFAMAIAMKCIKKTTDYSIEKQEELLHKYLTDPQYDEIKGEDNG